MIHSRIGFNRFDGLIRTISSISPSQRVHDSALRFDDNVAFALPLKVRSLERRWILGPGKEAAIRIDLRERSPLSITLRWLRKKCGHVLWWKMKASIEGIVHQPARKSFFLHLQFGCGARDRKHHPFYEAGLNRGLFASREKQHCDPDNKATPVATHTYRSCE